MNKLYDQSNQKGIALLLTVVILAAVIGLVISVSTIVLRVIRSNKAIGVSEVAFYAAEAAAELVIYDIEVNGRGLDIIDVVNEPLDTLTAATWDSQVRAQDQVPSLCSASQAKVVCGDGSTVINTAPLRVTLEDDQSFEMELDLVGASYPDQVTITWSGGSSEVHLMSGTDTSTETSSPVTFPDSGNIDPNDDDRFRITNLSGSSQEYVITPSNSTALPMGLKITTTGNFAESERVIELTHPSWIIY